MKKIIFSAIAALALTASSNAVSIVTVFGDLEEVSRPAQPWASTLPDLTAYELTFTHAFEIVPATLAELFPMLNGSETAIMSFFTADGFFSSRLVNIDLTLDTRYVAQIPWTTPISTNINSWTWVTATDNSGITVEFAYSSNDRLYLEGTANLRTAEAAVPDTGSTAALAGLGLLSIVIIRRKFARSC